MPGSLNAKQDHSASLDGAFLPVGLPWQVVSVQALPDFRVAVRFRDGLEGEVLMRGLIFGANAGVFASLRNPSLFATAHIEHHAVTWDGELDLAPDAMHAEISKNGRWTLGA
jgi:Protein of unknown function (DUF2442)